MASGDETSEHTHSDAEPDAASSGEGFVPEKAHKEANSPQHRPDPVGMTQDELDAMVESQSSFVESEALQDQRMDDLVSAGPTAEERLEKMGKSPGGEGPNEDAASNEPIQNDAPEAEDSVAEAPEEGVEATDVFSDLDVALEEEDSSASAGVAAGAEGDAPPSPDMHGSAEPSDLDSLFSAGEGDEGDVLSGSDLDASLDDKHIDDVITPSALEEPLDSSLAELGIIGSVPAAGEAETNALIQELTHPERGAQSVGEENLAAAAGQQDQTAEAGISEELLSSLKVGPGTSSQNVAIPNGTKLLSDDPSAPEQGEPEPIADSEPPTDFSMEEVELSAPEVEQRPPRRIDIKRFMSQHGLRAAASIAAGILAMLATGTILVTFQYQRPTLEPGALAPGDDLERAMIVARSQMDAANFRMAIEELDAALARASAFDALRSDARYLRLEAMYRLLPEAPLLHDAETMHGQIDAVLHDAPEHPRAPEALWWKAQVYEREQLPRAAQQTYDHVLATYPDFAQNDAVLMDAADLVLARGDAKESSAYLQTLLRDYPASPLTGTAKLRLGDTLARIGLKDDAHTFYTRLANSNSDNAIGAEAFARLGQMALDDGRYEEAVAQLSKRLLTATTTAGNEAIYLKLAEAHRALGEFEEAERLLRELRDFFPPGKETAQAMILLSQLLEQRGRRQEALRVTEQAVQDYPTNVDVLRNAGEMLERGDDPVKAARMLLAADAAGAREPKLLLSAARQFRKAAQYRDARDAYERLVLLFPTRGEALDGNIELSRLLYDTGQYRKSIERLQDLQRATKGKPQQLPILLALASIYEEAGLEQSAAELYSQVAGISAEPVMLARAAVQLVEAESWDEALGIAGRVEVAALEDKTAYTFLNHYGRAMQRTNSDRALELMEQAYANYPQERSLQGNLELLQSYLTSGHTNRARKLVMDAEAAARQDQTRAVDVYELGQVWADYAFERGDYRLAAEAYESTAVAAEAIGKSPDWARYQRANALLQVYDFTGSLEIFTQLAQANGPLAKEAGTKADFVRLQQRL